MCSKHQWKETNKIGPFAGETLMQYVRCETCAQMGFRQPPSPIVYTWHQPEKSPN